jgi:F0F1-type ATP synthase assembly protein I
LAVKSGRDFVSWTLFGGILGLLIGSFFDMTGLWVGAVIGLVVGFLGALWSNRRYKKEQEKYKV